MEGSPNLIEPMKNIKFISLKGLLGKGESPLVSLGNSFELPALIRRIGYRIIPLTFPRSVKFSSRLTYLLFFPTFLFKMRKHHGSEYVVKYLKACQLAISKKIAGTPFSTLRDIEPDLPLRRLSHGLPSVIPSYDRLAIRQGKPSIIRWWLTIFSLYRILSIPGTLKISTITDAFKGDFNSLALLEEQIPILCRSKFRHITPKVKIDRDPSLLMLETSSPNSKVS